MLRRAYLMPFLLIPPSALSLWMGGAWTWFLPAFSFVLLPLAEQLDRGSTDNPDTASEAARRDDPWFDRLAWGVVPAQYALLLVFLLLVRAGHFEGWSLAGAIATMGIACGVYGINVGHELGHRRRPFEQHLSKALLLTSGYVHFFVEHNRGHHRHVATPDDPASARRGESVYAFWLRSVVGSYRHAWSIENERLDRKGVPRLSWDNEMVRLSVSQGVFAVGVGLVGGLAGLAAWIPAAVIGFLLLETVNYLEHYGLVRHRKEHGGYERVRPAHSWNSNRPLGRAFLFDLTRHSDHHAHATRPYQVLRHHDEAPELPAGYPAMILLALVPPLFHRAMAGPLAAWDAVEAPELAA